LDVIDLAPLKNVVGRLLFPMRHGRDRTETALCPIMKLYHPCIQKVTGHMDTCTPNWHPFSD